MTAPVATVDANAKLDAAIALARRLVQDPRARGARLCISATWEDGEPCCTHGDISIHIKAGTPGEAWANEIAPERSGLMEIERVTSWGASIDGLSVEVYCLSPMPKTAEVVS